MTVEKLDLSSPDLVQGNIEKIRALFPNVVTEGPEGLSIDFDALRQELSDAIVEGPQERYRLDWPGKRAAMLAANTPISKTLRPVREESVDFDTTQNLFIEGDNLDALKLLQDSYLGKVKMIYIDPPYNTGKDFIYKDNFTQDKSTYLEKSGQVDEDGGRLVANPESNGRYHSDWLSMMYPRLKLARNLLRDDGVFLISLDENEINNARVVLDEIYGRQNFIGTIGWESKTKSQNTKDSFNKLQPKIEYILVYTRNTGRRYNLVVRGQKQYPEIDETGKYREYKIEQMDAGGIRGRGTMIFPILGILPEEGYQWKVGEEFIQSFETRGDLFEKNGRPYVKMRSGDERTEKTDPFWGFFSKEIGTAESAKSDLKKLLAPKRHAFDTVKPTSLLGRLTHHFTNKNDVILDFFGGSGSLAHAAMEHSLRFGSRHSITVQLDDFTGDSELSEESDYTSVADLSKERIRRAGAKILEENPDQVGKLDVGFRVLKIDRSNMKDVHADPRDLKQGELLDSVTHIKPDRSGEDLLFQVMLNQGIELSQSITRESVEGKTVYIVGQDNLIACFDDNITDDVVKNIAGRKPLYAIFRDESFKEPADKINAAQIFKQLTEGHTRMKVI